MIGKGYCELSIAKFNSRIYSFGGVNFKDSWIDANLKCLIVLKESSNDRKNDWRLQGQEEYLKGETLYYKKYTKYSDEWEHEHCEFCGDKISEYDGDLHEGYCTKDEKCWICEKCFNDFKEMFDWKVKK